MLAIVFLISDFLGSTALGQVASLAESGKQTPTHKPPRVLFDSYHAHNFLHRGLTKSEYSYHQYSGLRRAAKLLETRGCKVDELLVGPVSEETLRDVDLFVLNLPSMDRPPMLVSEILAIENYVRGGGGILFVTDHSNCYYHQYKLLPLWRPLGLIPTFETVCVADPDTSLSASGSGWALIRDFANHEITSGLRNIAIQTGGRVLGDGELAWTAEAAWADSGATPLYGEGDSGGLYGDWQRAASEVAGKQAVALARQVGGGRVCVIADQNCLSDAFIAYADNWRFWLNACRWTGDLQFETPKADSLRSLQVDCYEPLGRLANSDMKLDDVPLAKTGTQRRFDFGADDPDQLFGFWVWMNRFHWVGCGDEESRPPETCAKAKLLFVDGIRVLDPPFLVRARMTLDAGGKVIVLGAAGDSKGSEELKADDSEANGELLAALSAELVGNWRKVISREQADSEQIEVSQWELSFPASEREPSRSHGQVIFVRDASRLRSEHFPAPNQQPNGEQWELQQWLQGFLFSH